MKHCLFFAWLVASCLPATAIDWSGSVDLRAVSAHSTQSWTRAGLGKLRHDGDGLRLGQAMLRGDADLAGTVTATLLLNAADDRSGLLDVTEAWLRWNPLPSGPWKTSIRAGAFFPHMSLENDGLGWTPTRTVSSSAINSWIGEELRTIGIEAVMLRRGRSVGSLHDFGVSAAVHRANDPTGTLLTWRGWSIGDRITGLREPLLLADLPVYRPAGRLSRQTRSIHVFRELDGRVGYQAGATYGYGGWIELSAMHYDNRANPLVLEDGQWGWRTRFQHVGAKVRVQGWELLFQGMDGDTVMGRRLAAVDLRAWYLLASHPLGQGTLSARYDKFSTREDDIIAADPNSERGDGLALAYSYPLAPAWTLVGEVLAVRSTRAARAQLGEAPRQHERSITGALRWRF